MDSKSNNESKVYTTFFKDNCRIIIVSTLAFSSLGLYLSLATPSTFHIKNILEVGAVNEQQQIILTDEVVSITRTLNLQKLWGLDQNSKLNIFRTGNLLINIDIQGRDKEAVNQINIKAMEYLKEKYHTSRLGLAVEYQDKLFSYLYLLVFPLLGLALGILISLVKKYLSDY